LQRSVEQKKTTSKVDGDRLVQRLLIQNFKRKTPMMWYEPG
jgi:hypothetical protein